MKASEPPNNTWGEIIGRKIAQEFWQSDKKAKEVYDYYISVLDDYKAGKWRKSANI
ncbi:MAG: hypothetical protein JJW00_07055 [Sulfurimonas sp.]|nr:hypothetical protein [Sulfurimonas sp.]